MNLYERISRCKHLRLISEKEDISRIQEYVERCRQESGSQEAFLELTGFLFDRVYEPHCEKYDSSCVILESPILSIREYGSPSDPLVFLLTNTSGMSKCEGREIPEGCILDEESLLAFLHRRIVVPLLNKPEETK